MCLKLDHSSKYPDVKWYRSNCRSKVGMCVKCGLRAEDWDFSTHENTTGHLCWICYLTVNRQYGTAKYYMLDSDWYNYHTGIGEYNVGWSFYGGLLVLAFVAVLNSNNLNKRPKLPMLAKVDIDDFGETTAYPLGSMKTLLMLGWSKWRAETALKYNVKRGFRSKIFNYKRAGI